MLTLDMDLFAGRLRTLREGHGLTQTSLAAQAELNLGNVNELEHHHKPGVRAETILKLAQALHCSADFLLGLTDDPRPAMKRRKVHA
jgi:transcriptional regulator with XRE-family HTH domain